MKTSLGICMIYLVVALAVWAGTAQFGISGRVLDPADNAIHGVRIQAYRDHRSTGSPVTSNGNGSYKIEFDSGPPPTQSVTTNPIGIPAQLRTFRARMITQFTRCYTGEAKICQRFKPRM